VKAAQSPTKRESMAAKESQEEDSESGPSEDSTATAEEKLKKE